MGTTLKMVTNFENGDKIKKWGQLKTKMWKN